LFLAGASHASGHVVMYAGQVQESGPTAVAQAYQRDWPRAWQLAGDKSRDYGTAACRQWVGGYRCTVQDRVTKITVMKTACWSPYERWRMAMYPVVLEADAPWVSP
jgi:hypothetical protein